MRTLRLFLAFSVCTALFLVSCTKEAPIIDTPTDDTELLSALYDADALVGKGEVKADDKYSFTVRMDELPAELATQLSGRENFTLNNELAITPEQVQAIWGEQVEGTPLADGLTIAGKDHKVTRTYMTPDGESLTEQVEDNPNILADARDVLEYIYVEHGILIDGNGNVYEYIYIEYCSIVF